MLSRQLGTGKVILRLLRVISRPRSEHLDRHGRSVHSIFRNTCTIPTDFVSTNPLGFFCLLSIRSVIPSLTRTGPLNAPF